MAACNQPSLDATAHRISRPKSSSEHITSSSFARFGNCRLYWPSARVGIINVAHRPVRSLRARGRARRPRAHATPPPRTPRARLGPRPTAAALRTLVRARAHRPARRGMRRARGRPAGGVRGVACPRARLSAHPRTHAPPRPPPRTARAARHIRGAVRNTPCLRSAPLSEMVGADVWVKQEQGHYTGSFKERGARYGARLAARASRRAHPSAPALTRTRTARTRPTGCRRVPRARAARPQRCRRWRRSSRATTSSRA